MLLLTIWSFPLPPQGEIEAVPILFPHHPCQVWASIKQKRMQGVKTLHGEVGDVSSNPLWLRSVSNPDLSFSGKSALAARLLGLPLYPTTCMTSMSNSEFSVFTQSKKSGNYAEFMSFQDKTESQLSLCGARHLKGFSRSILSMCSRPNLVT